MKKNKSQSADLTESADDKKHLRPDKATLDLPDVNDIPGQENVTPLPSGEMADTTIASDDEEGTRVFDDDNISQGTNVTPEERQALREAANKMPALTDEQNLAAAQLDERDEDGELLNERTAIDGSDLDIPGSEDDDDNEETGEEDEENNAYSLGGEQEDNSISKE